MARATSSGRCRPPEPPKAPGRRRRPAQLYHLVVSGRYAPMYWLHLEAPSNASLEDLDFFLRRTWLECCGHLSAFRLGDRSFSSIGADSGWGDDGDLDIRLG